MTAQEMMTAIASAVQARLPGWAVYPYPVPEAAHRQVTMALGPANATPFHLSGPGVQGVLHLVATVSVSGPSSYYELADALDAIVLAVYDAHPSLLAGGVEIMPPAGVPEVTTGVDSDARAATYWRLDVRVPYRRNL